MQYHQVLQTAVLQLAVLLDSLNESRLVPEVDCARSYFPSGNPGPGWAIPERSEVRYDHRLKISFSAQPSPKITIFKFFIILD